MPDTRSRRETRGVIVDVAARLLREQGAAAVTTRGVAEAAGVQAPTIYRLFGDKDGLLDAVAEQVMATYVSAKSAIVEAARADEVDPLGDLRSGWDSHVEFGLANAALLRLLDDPDRVSPSPATQAGRAVLEARVRRVAETGRLRVSEQHAVDLVHAAGTGTIQALLALPVQRRDPELARSMWEAVARQILTDAPEPTDEPRLSAAVTFRAVAPRLDTLSAAEQHLLAEWLDRIVADLSHPGA